MKWRKESDNRILVYLACGETLRENLENLVNELKIDCGKIVGIGAFRNPVLGCFNFETREYAKTTLEGLWEVVSLNGNISLVQGKRFLHLHAALADNEYNVKGGHFFDAEIGVMAEIFIEPCAHPLHRSLAEATGLWAWDPERKQ